MRLPLDEASTPLPRLSSSSTREAMIRPLWRAKRPPPLASVPRLNSDPDALLSAIAGTPPDPLDRPQGCSFHPRCSLVKEHCKQEMPELEEVRSSEGQRFSACFEVREFLRERA